MVYAGYLSYCVQILDGLETSAKVGVVFLFLRFLGFGLRLAPRSLVLTLRYSVVEQPCRHCSGVSEVLECYGIGKISTHSSWVEIAPSAIDNVMVLKLKL